MTRTPSVSRPARTARGMTLAALLGAVLMSGCVGLPVESDLPVPLTPTSRYSLQVEPGIDRIALAVHETGLSGPQRSAIVDLAARFAREGASVVTIEAPAGEDPVAVDMAWKVRSALETAGVSGGAIQVVSYSAPDARAPVLLGFETLQAAVPRCGTNWGSLTRSATNQPSSNFGCAVNANLAAQIETPRDIVTPRQMTPSDAARRGVVFANYRTGQNTAATQEQMLTNRRVARAVE